MKHTPGPWEVGGPYPGVSVIVCVDPGITQGPDPVPPVYDPICVLDQRTKGEQSQQALADAHLIAAAPDLLKALRKAAITQSHDQECPAFGFEDNGKKCRCWYQMAWNAINKADGKE